MSSRSRSLARTTSIVDANRLQMDNVEAAGMIADGDGDENKKCVKILASVLSARYQQANTRNLSSELKRRSLAEYWMQGSTIGESHLLCNSRPTADVTARTFCQTKALTRASLHRVLQKFPETENLRSVSSYLGIEPDFLNFDPPETTYASVKRGQGLQVAFQNMPGAVLLELDLCNIAFDTDLDCILEALAYELST